MTIVQNNGKFTKINKSHSNLEINLKYFFVITTEKSQYN